MGVVSRVKLNALAGSNSLDGENYMITAGSDKQMG